MKILLLNQAFYPDVASTAQHASDLAAKLTDRGHEVTVVCSRRAYDNPRERYRKRESWCGIQIRRISSFGFGKKARWRRAASLPGRIVKHPALRQFPEYSGSVAPSLPMVPRRVRAM